MEQPASIDYACQADRESTLYENIERVSSTYAKMVQLEQQFRTNITTLKAKILPHVSKLCPGMESRIVKRISLLAYHAEIVSLSIMFTMN